MNIVIYPPNDSIFFHVANFPIRYYGIIMASVFLVGVILAYFLFKKVHSKATADLFVDYSPLAILFSIIGARIFYVLGSLNYYLKFPNEILMIHHGGLSIIGAIIFGVIAMLILSKVKKFDFLIHCDIIGTVCPLCQAIGRFGNYFNQEAFGTPTNGFLKLFVDKKFRPHSMENVEFYHPTFLYEAILDLLVFFVLLFLLLKSKKLKTGTITYLYLILYSIVRLIVEYFRIDSVLNLANIPIASILSILILVLASLFLFKLYSFKP